MNIRSKLISSFIAAGVTAASSFVAYDLTLPSEGFKNKVYSDPVGLPTVCVGHMDKNLKRGQSFSDEDCLNLFAKDWVKHQKQLDSLVKVSYASEWQRAALTDFTFNVGIGNVRSSTLIKLLNQGRHEEACIQLLRWNKAGGRVLRGLVIRRENTLPYCLGKVSEDKQKSYEEFVKEWENEMAKRLEKDSKNL